MYTFIFTKKADKDSVKLARSNLKRKIEDLLSIIKANPFQNPPPFKKLSGEYEGYYARRINIQHRLYYEVDELNKSIKILRMWSHYGDN